MAGIKIIEVRPEPVAEIIRAPGEVVLNAYRTAHVTPRIEAQIIARKARLGDAVEQGQALVTLSSVGMAEAQGALLVANREWQRVRKLGRKVVSERRYIEAQVARQQAYAKVLAYGMTQAQIDRLLREGKASSANGTFDLLSPQDGTVISDDFIIGELAAAGRLLFTITDETTLWVDARLTPEEAGLIETGAAVAIRTGQLELPGKVIQIKHALDEKTRTWPVRIEVANPDDVLHPGLFVTAEIRSNRQETAIAVPVAAVLRSPDGDWQVFVEEEPGHYTPKEVTVVRPAGNRMIVTGLSTGERIVGEGAFFVQSEIAKSGFEVHDH
ncbi:MAG TPA: efflux RND transporter periplasmic adaptor subunit [Thiotrichales bacterium]|nr:efflux RND transporter periplasmic adaptor subunit [Thiotrichales bacterium]